MTIYFTQNKEGLIKIGYSTDVNSRIKALQTANPHPLTVLKTIPGDLGREKLIHDRFAYCKVNDNEWFYPSIDLIDLINEQPIYICQKDLFWVTKSHQGLFNVRLDGNTVKCSNLALVTWAKKDKQISGYVDGWHVDPFNEQKFPRLAPETKSKLEIVVQKYSGKLSAITSESMHRNSTTFYFRGCIPDGRKQMMQEIYSIMKNIGFTSK